VPISKSWVIMLATVLLSVTAVAQSGGEVIIPEGTRIAMQVNDYLSTKQNDEGDEFTATVSEPVIVKERVVIPKGSIISGSISRLLRPGRFKGKAQMNLLFNSVRIQGSQEIPIVATLVKWGDQGAGVEGSVAAPDSKGKDVAKVAAPAATGAGIGAIVNGGKGAAIGAGIGAVAGIFASRGADLEIKRGCSLEIVLNRPLTISK
jgi:hypothetical protein